MKNLRKLKVIFLIFAIIFTTQATAADRILPIPKPTPDEETKVKIEVDLTKIQVEMDEKHSPRIQLTDDIGLLMQYPNLGDVLAMGVKEEKTTTIDKMFSMMQD